MGKSEMRNALGFLSSIAGLDPRCTLVERHARNCGKRHLKSGFRKWDH